MVVEERLLTSAGGAPVAQETRAVACVAVGFRAARELSLAIALGQRRDLGSEPGQRGLRQSVRKAPTYELRNTGRFDVR